MLEIMLYY